MPPKISHNVAQPDQLKIKFVESDLFVDKQDFTNLRQNMTIEYAIPPQINTAEVIELQSLSSTVASAMTTITIGILLLQVCLHFGLKYLWNIMNLVQFLIFMQMWLISLPSRARIFLRELKQLALCEFIPYEWLKSGEATKPIEVELVEEQVGIDRFGTNSLVDGMGSFLVIGIAISVIMLVLILLRLLSTKSAFIMKCFLFLKHKMQYNALLRFVLQSTLKLHVAACTVIVYERLTVKEVYEPTTQLQLALAGIILAILNLCPFLFGFCLLRNRRNLDE